MGEAMRAREYLRVSYDKSGRERSNVDQQADHRRRWPDWQWGEPYSDAISASKYAKRKRKDWPRLLADLRASEFGADLLVMWESSRGSRRVGEWVELCDLCEARSVLIAVHEHNRIYDPANPRDRRTLLEDAVDSEYETAKTSGRLRRTTGSAARAGRPHGKRLFGYRRNYDPKTGLLIGQSPDPIQAPVVRRVFGEYVAGMSARSIARWLNAEGVRTNRGNGWTAQMVQRMLRNPAYVARRVYRGEVIGPASWELLVDDGTFERAQRRHESVAWRKGRVTSRQCSGIARSRCGGRMEVKHSKSGVFYGCQKDYCAYRGVDRLDAYVTAAVLERLAQPDAAEFFNGDDPAVDDVRAQLAALKAELDEAMDLWRQRDEQGRRRLSAQAYAAMEADLLPRIADAERAVRRAYTPLDVDVPQPDRLEEWWYDELTPEQRREYTAALIVQVTVLPTGRGRRTFKDDDYTVIEWR